MPSTHENEVFEDQIIQLDGNKYIRCKFQRCTLQFGGLADVSLENCEFHRSSWSFTEAAARTIQFMTGLYHGAGEGGRELIEKTFENIRQKRHP
jgi:hypothetical protein